METKTCHNEKTYRIDVPINAFHQKNAKIRVICRLKSVLRENAEKWPILKVRKLNSNCARFWEVGVAHMRFELRFNCLAPSNLFEILYKNNEV